MVLLLEHMHGDADDTPTAWAILIGWMTIFYLILFISVKERFWSPTWTQKRAKTDIFSIEIRVLRLSF